MRLTAEQIRSLSEFFREIKDPPRAKGKKHRIHVGYPMRNARLQSNEAVA